MQKIILLLCVVVLGTIAQAKPVKNAELRIDKNNIRVWTYQNPQNPVFSYKAETIYQAPIEHAVALILDVEHAVQWVPYMASVKMLSRDDRKGDFTLYMVLDFPFPLKDRDLVVQGKILKAANGQISIRNRAIQSSYGLNPDYVRLSDYQGDWTFQKLGPNKVKVSTSGYANPEGAIPLSFVNRFVQQQPYQMLQQMQQQLNTQTQSLALPEILR